MIDKGSFTDFIYWLIEQMNDNNDRYVVLQEEYQGKIIKLVNVANDYKDQDLLIVQSDLLEQSGWVLYNELFILLEQDNSTSITFILRKGAEDGLIGHNKEFDDLPLDEIIAKVAEIQKKESKRRFWILHLEADGVKLTRVYEILDSSS